MCTEIYIQRTERYIERSMQLVTNNPERVAKNEVGRKKAKRTDLEQEG